MKIEAKWMPLVLRSVCTLSFAVALHASAHAAPPTRSEVAGFVLTPLANLPRAPKTRPLDAFCAHYRADAKSDAARQVAARGWIVTSEARLGRYQAVSFAGAFEPGTSGVCAARDANIAVFDGASLVALAYAARGAKETLGRLEPLDSGLLVGNGEGPLAPVAELHEIDGGLVLTAVAPIQKVCGGKAEVPNVYGLPIATARKRLLAKGWRPERPKEAPPEGDRAADLAKQGIIEAEGCSGTGYGFCGFTYRAAAGTLGVTTVGEDETVVSYGATCP